MPNYYSIRRRITEKTAPFCEEKYALPPWQRINSNFRRRHCRISRIRLRISASSTVFSKFGLLRLLFVSKLEKITHRAAIRVELGGYRRHGGLLCRPPENVFFRRVKEVGTPLGQVYQPKRRLCWEINCHFSKFSFFFSKLSTYRTALVLLQHTWSLLHRISTLTSCTTCPTTIWATSFPFQISSFLCNRSSFSFFPTYPFVTLAST